MRAPNGEFLPFYVPRDQMPQIDAQYLSDFLMFLASKGVVPIRHLIVPPQQLRAHQRIDKRIVHKYMANMDQAAECVTSEDDFICDGNHRWWAHRLKHTDVPIIRLPLLFEDALKVMFEYPRTYIDRRPG